MYPTVQSEINPKSKDQIKTGLELNKPTSGKATDITVENNWSGFDVDSETNLVVLEAESEGTPGNGETTCTLCQKGSNYFEAEEEKNANRKACNLIEGSSVALGSRIECGGEYFHVISVTENSVKMLADSTINSNTGKQFVTGESSEGALRFNTSTSTYWLNGSTLKSEYGTSYPAYVYDSNSSAYSLINEYKNYLVATVGLKNPELFLIDVKDLVALGCNIAKNSCSDVPIWVQAPESGYLTGSVTSDKKVYGVFDDALFTFGYSTTSSCPRPVVVISLDEIKV